MDTSNSVAQTAEPKLGRKEYKKRRIGNMDSYVSGVCIALQLYRQVHHKTPLLFNEVLLMLVQTFFFFISASMLEFLAHCYVLGLLHFSETVLYSFAACSIALYMSPIA